MGKNLFKYKLESVEDITNQTFYSDFLAKESDKNRSGRVIYILISEVSFNMISKIARDINALRNDLKLVIIFNQPQDVRDLIKKFMNNIQEGSSSTKGKYSINANSLMGMLKDGTLEFKKANSKYHFNVISGYTTLLGIEKLSVDKNFKNGYVFWEDYEDYTQEVRHEIEKIYREATEATEINELIKYIRNDYQVEEIYYLMLLNLFQVQEYESEKREIRNMKMSSAGLWNQLFDFQKDGVYGLIHRLNKHGFAMLGDSVGLGKTYQALAVLQYFQEKQGVRTLILSPVKLYENWNNENMNQKTKSFDDVHLSFEVHHHTTVTNQTIPSGGQVDNFDYSIYDLLIIDEAHAFRNRKSKRYIEVLKKILGVNPRMKVLLLTATPVNNTLKDLESLIFLMSKGAKRINTEHGNIEYSKTIKTAQWRLDNNLDAGDDFYDMLDEFLVSRDKAYINEIYENSDMKFPQKNEVISLTTEASEEDKQKIIEFYDKVSNMNYAMYNYYQYLKDETKLYLRKQSANISERSQGMKSLMRILLLKRYESTYHSLENTIEKMIKQMENMNQISNERTEQFKINILENDSNDILNESEVEGIELPFETINRSDFMPEFFVALEEDIRTLKSIIEEPIYKQISDKKIKELETCVKTITNGGKKVIVFTSYSDTAHELSSKFIKNNIKHGLVTGTEYKIYLGSIVEKKTKYEEVLREFSPISKRHASPKCEFDVLIATDVISEGQNLQDCSNIINFDVHWNPVRIIQRLGRIDRLNSEHEFINNYIFWPLDSLEEYLNMKERIDKKNKYIQAVGAEGYELESEFNTTKEHLEQVAKGIDIDENNIQLSNKAKSIKKFELDYKRMKHEADEESIFYNVIDFVSELRGVNTYVYSNEITQSCFLLYRVSSKNRIKSEFYPYILIELDKDLRIKKNQVASLETIKELYAQSLLLDFKWVEAQHKKEFYHQELKNKLDDIVYYITKNFDGVSKEEISLISSLYVLPTDENPYYNSDVIDDRNYLSPRELDSKLYNKDHVVQQATDNNAYVCKEKANDHFNKIC